MKKNFYKRDIYVDAIRPFYHSDLIKVITGIRRCGKSSLLQIIIEDLIGEGIKSENIIQIKLDERNFLGIKKNTDLNNILNQRVVGEEKKYIFLDEVQRVKDFEVVVEAYRTEGHSIFLTGSNSYLLSGELSTYLTGRYIEFDMFPLSFKEYIGMKAFLKKNVSENSIEEFTSYITDGGFPQALEFDESATKQKYVKNIVEQIIKRDILHNKRIRNKEVFDKVKTFIINNFGASMNMNNILELFINNKTKVSRTTIYRDIELLKNAKLIYECPRFDMKSKKELKGDQKFYLADLSLYYCGNTDNRINYGPVLENVVYCYLISKGYSVSVGRIGKLECDFIIRKNKSYAYIQVAMTIAEKKTEDREYRVFSQIRDNWPKYLLTLDYLLQNRDGVKHLNIVDMLLNEVELL